MPAIDLHINIEWCLLLALFLPLSLPDLSGWRRHGLQFSSLWKPPHGGYGAAYALPVPCLLKALVFMDEKMTTWSYLVCFDFNPSLSEVSFQTRISKFFYLLFSAIYIWTLFPLIFFKKNYFILLLLLLEFSTLISPYKKITKSRYYNYELKA